MTTATYEVRGMTCGHCVAAVSSELAKLPGVDDVAVDLNTGTSPSAAPNPWISSQCGRPSTRLATTSPHDSGGAEPRP